MKVGIIAFTYKNRCSMQSDSLDNPIIILCLSLFYIFRGIVNAFHTKCFSLILKEPLVALQLTHSCQLTLTSQVNISILINWRSTQTFSQYTGVPKGTLNLQFQPLKVPPNRRYIITQIFLGPHYPGIYSNKLIFLSTQNLTAKVHFS